MSPSPTCSRIATACLVALLWGQAKAAPPPVAPALTPEIMADLRFQLSFAIKDHDSKRVTWLLAQGADLSPIAEYEFSPLVQAIQADDLPIFSILLKAGADPMALTDGYALPPHLLLTEMYFRTEQIPTLFAAASNPNPQFALRLLEKGANPNEGPCDFTALDVAAATNHPETYQGIAKSTNALSPEAQAQVTLIASKNASFKMLQYFKSQAIPIDTQSLDIGIAYAAGRGDTLAVKEFLTYGASLESPTGSPYSPILFAAQNQQLQMVQYLLANHVDIDTRGPEGETPLMGATQGIDSGVVALLLAKGANVNLKDKHERNALFNTKAEYIPMLLKHKIDINAVDHHNISPLLEACDNKQWLVAAALLDAGADVTLVSDETETALSRTVFYDNFEFARRLVAKHPPLNLVPYRGNTILQTTITSSHSTFADILGLLQQGANPSLPGTHHWTPAEGADLRSDGDYLALLMKFGAKGDFRKSANKIILAAVHHQDTQMLATALKQGCSIHARDITRLKQNSDDNGASSIRKDPSMVIQTIRDFQTEALAMLLSHGAKPNTVNADGIPALLLAIKNYNYEAVKLLLDYKVMTECKDPSGNGVVAYLAKLAYPQMDKLFIGRVIK